MNYLGRCAFIWRSLFLLCLVFFFINPTEILWMSSILGIVHNSFSAGSLGLGILSIELADPYESNDFHIRNINCLIR